MSVRNRLKANFLSVLDSPNPIKPYDMIDLANRLQRLNSLLKEISTENIYLKEKNKLLDSRIHGLEKIIKPDETDVYNINKRIELLARRIAVLESSSKR